MSKRTFARRIVEEAERVILPQIPTSSGGGITALTGDVTASGTGSVAATIANDAVTNAKLADMAAGTIKGNNTGGAANPLDLTASQVKTLLAIAAGDVSGLGTLATQNGTFSGTSSGTNTGDQTSVSGNAGTATALQTGRTIAITGDVAYTSPAFDGTGNVTAAGTIQSGAVTLAKMANLAANSIIGNNTGSPAAPLALTTAQVKTLLAIAAGDVSGLGTLATQNGTFSGTSSGANTGDQNLFSTIAVSGQSNVVADSTSDTLTLAAGSGIAITTDAGTDTVTIAATGGGGGGDASLLFGAITTTSTTSNTVWSAVTGSEVTVVAGRTYAIRWRLRTYSAAATTGLRLRRALAGGAVGTVFGWHALVMNAAIAMNGRASREGTVDTTTGASLGNATSTTTDAGTHWVDCLFQCTTGGTIGLELQSEVNTSSCTVDGDGSYWEAVWRTT